MAKNNKKSFSDDLSNIFEYTINEDNKKDKTDFLSGSEKVKGSVAVADENKETQEKRKVQRKSFSDGLESFFKESIEDMLGDQGTVTEIKQGLIKKGSQKAVGIDVIIQRTLTKSQEADDEIFEKFPKTKRITFVLDTEKVEHLKNIARNEKKHMRQIISSLVDSFLNTGKI
jgi:hypothetical protein